jgi:hypothetical protein
MAHYWLAQVYAQMDKYDHAIVEARKGRELSGDSGSSWVLGYIYAVAGKRDEALQEIKLLFKLSKQHYVPPYDIAVIYADSMTRTKPSNGSKRPTRTAHEGWTI